MQWGCQLAGSVGADRIARDTLATMHPDVRLLSIHAPQAQVLPRLSPQVAWMQQPHLIFGVTWRRAHTVLKKTLMTSDFP